MNNIIIFLEKEIHALFAYNLGCIGIIYLEKLVENIHSFENVLDKHTRKSAIHFVAKVNQSNACMKKAIQLGCRIEVSSYGELKKSLLLGASHSFITGSGPKNIQFLEKLIEIGAVISVDSIFEIRDIIKISRNANKKTQILLRISGFRSSLPSRFGIDIFSLDDCICLLNEGKECLDVLGVGFHLDAHGIENRQEVFWECVDQIEKFYKQGINISVIDIGGGYGVVYKNDLTEDNEVCARRKGNKSRLYPDNNEPKGSEFLEQLLKKEHIKYGSISSFLKDSGIILWIEPGRALYKDVGYILTRVISERSSFEGDALILDTNSFALGMREEEIPTNPYILGNIVGKTNHYYYLLGNLCLESDYIFSRKVGFTRKIQIGDILVFPDLGAYHMDFYETTSILQPNKSRYFIENSGNKYSIEKETKLLNF